MVAIMLVYVHPSPCNDSFVDIVLDLTILVFGFIAYHLTQRHWPKATSASFTKASSAKGVDFASRRIQTSLKPVPAPVKSMPPRQPRQTVSFLAGGWDAEVAELLSRIVPTPTCEHVASQLEGPARDCVRAIIPEAEVSCWPNVRLNGNTDVGSLEADVVLTVSPETLAQRLEAYSMGKLQEESSRGKTIPQSVLNLAPSDLALKALRILTKLLVKGPQGDEGFFLYHHCSYRGDEPKVVLRVPAKRGLSDRDIFVSIFVNCRTPCHSAGLMDLCRRHDRRAAELALLARRWARDRGISFAAKGHLPPYAWTVLSAFFLQRHTTEHASGAPILPRFGSCGQEPSDDKKIDGALSTTEKEESVASLFVSFLRFYGRGFDWGKGTISVLSGCHEVRRGHSDVLISIEDPFDSGRDLAASLSEVGLARLFEEFLRANTLLDNPGTGLKELLDPWMPTAER
jgi:hypothetical protein